VLGPRLQSLPRVSLGRALTLPRGTVGLRRKPQTPPLGTFSTVESALKLQEDGADMSVMANRRRPRLPVRDPLWRQEVAFRFAFPVVAVVAAVIAGWMITQL
jgi:hypothetical protein